MPDVFQPLALQNTTRAALAALNDFATDLLARTNLELWLYQNNVALSATNTLATIVEADFGGYVRATVAAFTGPFLDASNTAYMQSALETFVANGTSGNSIYGAALVATPPGGTLATATNPGAAGAYAGGFVITAGGAGYTVAPRVRLTGATGAGATAHAEITGGVVTAIVLDTPGAGYTTFTVVIDPPLELLVQMQLSTTGISMSLATDALPTYVQLDQPSSYIPNP